MSQPITPRYFATDVVLGNLTINYKPEWDGVTWAITPSEIILTGIGQLAEDTDGNNVIQADIIMPATDLPAAGVTALQELLQFMESALAEKYNTP